MAFSIACSFTKVKASAAQKIDEKQAYIPQLFEDSSTENDSIEEKESCRRTSLDYDDVREYMQPGPIHKNRGNETSYGKPQRSMQHHRHSASILYHSQLNQS